MKKTLLLLILLLATPSLMHAGACSGSTLDFYITSGFSCTINGMTFSSWGYSAVGTTGAGVVPASGVNVIPCPSANSFCSLIPAGEEGFVFTAAWGATSGQRQGSFITYTVTSSTDLIDAIMEEAGFGQTGTASASVTETLSNGGTLFFSDPPGSPSAVTLTFPAVPSLTVTNDIEILGGTSDTAAISVAVNGFSQLRASTTTTVVSNKNPSSVGQSVTLTATVAPTGPPAPTGTVVFTSNGATISGCSAVTLTSSRTAACTTTALAAGADTVKASYLGDSNYASSGGTVTQTVNKLASTTTVVSNKNPSTMNDVVRAYTWYLVAREQISRVSKNVGEAISVEQRLEAERAASNWLSNVRKIFPSGATRRENTNKGASSA